MGSSETIAVAEIKVCESPSLSLSTIVRDVATMGTGTIFAAIFGTLLVFLIPRLVSVEDYGYWRLFLLYASYAGFLHLGFADGALLSWVGRPLEDFHHEVSPSMRFLFYQQLALTLPASLILAVFFQSNLRFLGVSILSFALVMNCFTLLQYSLQGARQFKPVAIATAAPSGIFVALVLFWELKAVPGFRELIVLYFVAWIGMLIYLLACVRPRRRGSVGSAWKLGKTYILLGWPIVLANTGYNLVAAADRLVVSSALPIYVFAQYSLAASAMFVPVTVIAAIYRVFFTHLAALEREGRTRVYAQVSKLLLLLWSLLLPYYFVLEVFVRRFLPKYVLSLPAASVLLLGVIFLADIQILHMSYFYLHGRQRQFLFLAIVALILSFSVTLAMALWARSLVAVAISQVTVVGLWWLCNEWKLQKITGQTWKGWFQVLGVFAWSSVSYILVLSWVENVGLRIPIYYALVAIILLFACPDEFRFCWRMIRSSAFSRIPIVR